MQYNIKKIVLVNPPMRLEQAYSSWKGWAGHSPPTGLCYVSSLLRKNGYDVSIVDAEALGLGAETAAQEILKLKPQIVGITAKTLWVVNAHHVARALKEKAPEIPIVAGGNHVTALPERTLKEFPCFDIVVIGEGEITFPELVKALAQGRGLSGVAGLAFRDKDNICLTGHRGRIRNLDELPPPSWDLIPDIPTYYRPWLTSVKKLPAFSLITSRGCPSQCTFCDRSVFGNYIASHSPEYIAAMIKELSSKYSIRYIMFDDDNLLLNKERLFRLFELLKECNLRMPFSCQSRVDTIDEEMLTRLKEAGCRQIQFGIESGSQKILDAMKKNITLEQIHRAITMTRKKGIDAMGFFILGYPGETEETLQDTLKLIKKCGFFDIGIAFFTPLPGSTIYQNISEYGAYKEDWEKMNSLDAGYFVPYGLSAEILIVYSNRCY